MVSRIVRHLRDCGPSTAAELPYRRVSSTDRMNGVWCFKPKGTGTGSSCGNTAGTLISVYYLRGEHSPDAVVEKWLEANERNVEESPPKALRSRLRRQGPEFHAAIDDALPTGGVV